jgi:beta-lactamase regulating signal transducer with metallopeptidase domain
VTHLIAALWQGLAIVGIVHVLIGTGRRLTAATRHVMWWSALAAVAGVTLVHAIDAAGDLVLANGGASVAVGSVSTLVVPAAPRWLATALAAIWIVSVLWHGRRFVLALRSMAAIRRQARPLDAALVDALPCWSRLPPHERRASLVLSPEVAGASALGLSRRPLIVLSEPMTHALEPPDLDQIVLHERAHLMRGDDWTRALQWLVTAVLGLHPAVRLINRRLDVERETACDDDVVAMVGSASGYATCLARAAAVAAREARWSPALMPGASERGTLLVRVRRLLDSSTPRGGGLQMPAIAAGAAVLMTCSVVGASLAPLIIVASGALPVVAAASPPGFVAASAIAPVAVPALDVHAVRQIHIGDGGPVGRTPRHRGAFERDGPGAAALRSRPPGTVPTTSTAAETAPAGASGPATATPLASTAFGPEFRLEPPSAAPSRDSDVSAWAEPGAAVARRFTRFGAATGSASRQTGRSIAGFFSRSGKALAERF